MPQKTASEAKALRHFAQVTSSLVNSPYLPTKTLKTCRVHKTQKQTKLRPTSDGALGYERHDSPREIRQMIKKCVKINKLFAD